MFNYSLNYICTIGPFIIRATSELVVVRLVLRHTLSSSLSDYIIHTVYAALNH